MGIKQRSVRPGTTFAGDESYGRSDIYMSGGAINANDIVIVNGNHSGYIRVAQADASAFSTARGILLVACNAASAAGQEVRCRETRHLVGSTASPIDTSTSAVNAPVYLSDTAGSWSLTPGTVPVIVGRVINVHATTGRIAYNTYADASTAGAVSGTVNATFTINEDGAAGTNEDPTLILEGGDGGAELINSMLQQDSSADRAYLWTSTTITGTGDRSSHLTIGPPGDATAGTVDADSTITLRGHVNGAAVGTWITGVVSLDAGTDTLSVEAPSSTITIGGAAVAEAVNIATGAAARVITIGNALSASMALDAGVGAFSVLADTTVDLDAGTALGINSSGGAISIGNDAVAQAVNIATGAAARVITIGNAASASMALDAGVGALTVQGDTTIDIDAGTALGIESAGGAINVGADAVAQPVNIATGAAARAITIGNAASASMALDAGVGALTVLADTTIDIDAGTALGIESAGGAISLGADAVAQAVNIATGAAARVITIGNAASASLALDAGVGALTVLADTTVDIDAGTALGINSSGGAVNVGTDVVAQPVNIATAGARALALGSAAATGITLDSILLSIDSTDTTNLTMSATAVGNKVLTIAATNAGAGEGQLSITATDQLDVGSATASARFDAGVLATLGVTTMDLDCSGALSLNSSAGAINVGDDAVAQAVNIATGAAARVITIGNAASASLAIDAGVGALTVLADTTIDIDSGTALAINSSGGAIAIGNDAVAQPVNIATGAAARVITIGNAASASMAIDAGVGALTVQGDTTVDIDAGTALGIESAGGAINVGADAVAQPVNIATGAAARAITIGNAASASLALDAGVGALTVQGDTTVDIDAGTALGIESAGGAINVGADAVAQAVNIATGAAARVITIGNAASASLAVDGGVGAFTVQADGTGTITSGGDLTLSATGAGAAILRAAISHDMSHRNQIVLFDDFNTYQNGFTEVNTPWILTNGGGAGATDPAVPATQQEGGVIVLTSANGAVGKATAFSQIISDMPFQADSGGLVFECRLHINVAATTTYVACGLTDAEGEIPVSIGVGNALTTTASDFVGFVYDTDADTDQWFGVGVDTDVDDTGSAAVGTAPVAGTYQTLRIEVSDHVPHDGVVIRFYINGAEVLALAGDAGVSPDVDLFAFVMISNDTAGGAQRSIDVDYAYCAVNR